VIAAQEFVEAARARGFLWYAGVPCSYLTPFINYVLQEPSLHYLSMANEGDAVALIAGVTLGSGSGSAKRCRGVAMMQNSGLGNAVSPLTSLTWTFRLPQLLIVTWRAQPGVADEPQHGLMGPITPQLLDLMQIPWELFPTGPAAINPALERAVAHMDATGRPYALLMQKDSIAGYPLQHSADLPATPAQVAAVRVSARPALARRVSREQALRQVVARTAGGSTVLLASTGYCGRELYAIEDRANHFYMVGSMGCVTTLALGLALSRPDLRVVALDGDGAALMRMGAFATIGAYRPPNLWHLLLDNASHDSTGGQATVSPQISFAGVAAACGYAAAMETAELTELAAWLDAAPLEGPRFACLFTRGGTPAGLPRPALGPVEVKERLMRHVGSGARGH
jgi:phosphonopyruvate decarboxylase